MWSVWLLFCDFDFHSVCPLMDKDKRFMEDSWWERLTAGKTESWILLNIHWKDWCWSWSSNTLATWWEELTYVKRPWYWERLKVGGEGNDRGWDGWMASPTRWPWVWVNARSWWWTGKPGLLQSMGSQRVGHDWATELNELNLKDKALLWKSEGA